MFPNDPINDPTNGKNWISTDINTDHQTKNVKCSLTGFASCTRQKGNNDMEKTTKPEKVNSSKGSLLISPQYWVCIIGPVDRNQMPDGFDFPPRRAAIKAIENAGIKVGNCWSGWGCDERRFNNIMEVWNTE